MSSTGRKLVVAGATGKQGGSLIAALVANPNNPFEIYAITRNTTSASAQALAKNSKVHLVQGDLANPKAIFEQVPKPWGFFSVTLNPSNHKAEESEGKGMTTAALAAGVKHIVFTATDRGGEPLSDTNPTPVPHFASKFNIEKDIEEQAPKHGATWTFLRPVAFMENMTNDFLGKGFVSMWRLNGEDSKIQLVSTKDIGGIAAKAFLGAETEEYRNKAIGIAGDEISVREAGQAFKEWTGKELISTYSLVARGLKWALHEQLGIMFNWFKSDGFGVDVKALRQRYPELRDFKAWLREESAWKRRA